MGSPNGRNGLVQLLTIVPNSAATKLFLASWVSLTANLDHICIQEGSEKLCRYQKKSHENGLVLYMRGIESRKQKFGEAETSSTEPASDLDRDPKLE